MKPDVAIVGAGPVGLWVAIQTKKWQPGFAIVCHERNTEYVRSHVLRLEKLSSQLYANPRNCPATKKFLTKLGSKSSVTISTKDLESELRSYAESLGVVVCHQEVESPASLMKQYPECQFFVAADGAHSRMRTALLGGSSTSGEALQYCVELKYRVCGAAQELEFWSDQRKINAKSTSMATEHVGRESGGLTPITLRFFVDDQTYAAMPEATFKNPLSISDQRIPANLAADIRDYLSFRRDRAGEKFDHESAKISKLVLSVFCARKFAVRSQGRFWFLAGDAAMGLPYFRSLNSGMVVGSQLAAILAQKLMPGPVKVLAYEACKVPDTAVEFAVAHAKNLALNAMNLVRKFRLE